MLGESAAGRCALAARRARPCGPPRRPVSRAHAAPRLSGAAPQVAERLGVHVGEVRNVIIWGNHSSTQFPDVSHGTVGGRPIAEAVADEAWLHGEFIATVQQRGAAIIKARAPGLRVSLHARRVSPACLCASAQRGCPTATLLACVRAARASALSSEHGAAPS